MKPTFTENLRFFFDYQLNFMYWRYFLWNFSGRQNDLQGNGAIDKGNWITGINFIDKYLVGDQTNLPTSLAENKGRNTYYLLPLILGILGILSQIYGGKKGQHDFWVTFLLFFMLGISHCSVPESDTLSASRKRLCLCRFVLCFQYLDWVRILEVFKSFKKCIPATVSSIIVTLLCLCVPALMASENWDDHD